MIYGAVALAAGMAVWFATSPARPARSTPALAQQHLAGTTNILLIGTDKPSIGKTGTIEKRTDVLLLVSCDPGRGRVSLLSIPRDTLVDFPSRGRDRINAANVYGGIPLTKMMVEKLTGLTVHRYLAVNFQAFVELVDLMGGVEVFVDKRMYYRDDAQGLVINLHRGRQLLLGGQALGFVRYRKDAMGDITRVQRQQRLLAAVLAKARQERLWTRVFSLYRLKRRYTRTDISLLDMYRLRNFARDLADSSRIASFTIPGWFSGPCWEADTKALAALIAREFEPPKRTPAPGKGAK